MVESCKRWEIGGYYKHFHRPKTKSNIKAVVDPQLVKVIFG